MIISFDLDVGSNALLLVHAGVLSHVLQPEKKIPSRSCGTGLCNNARPEFRFAVQMDCKFFLTPNLDAKYLSEFLYLLQNCA